MSVAFVPPQKGRPSPSPAQIQKMLDENSQLIQGILDYQSKGKSSECLQYQQILHRNLVYLASIADAVPSILPPPPTQVVGAANQPSSVEPPRIPSPAMSQVPTQQSQMNSGPRGSQQGPPGPPSGSAQGPVSSSSPHPTYSMTSQSNSQGHQPVVNHVHSPSTQQSPSTQATHSTSHSTPNNTGGSAAAYTSRSVTPQQQQQYGSVQGGAPQQQQYSATYSSTQGQSPHPYGGSVQSPNSFSQQQGSSANFPNEATTTFQTPVTQSQGFASGNPPQSQQVATNPNQQQQQHGPQAPDYAGNAVPQTSYTSAPTAATASQSYTTQSSQTYVTQTQSYNSASTTSSTTPWYQAGNAPPPPPQQPCSSAAQQNFPPSTVTQQGYTGGPMNHSVNFGSQPAGSAQSGGYGSPPTSVPSQVQGFVHHSPSTAPPHESPPPSTPVQPNRFTSNFSNYVHYRPSAQQSPHAMGPPSNNPTSRPQVPSSNNPQNQNYNYDQSQTYPYQSQ